MDGELNATIVVLPGENSMTNGASDASTTAPCGTERPGRETVNGPELPWWRSDPVWFWSFALLFAVTAWWPLVFNSRSGLQGGDIYTYFFPLKAWYAERLRAGELPLWNPLVGHGFPALGESQTGVFYPFNLVFYRFLPLGAAYNANFVLHYVLAFAFTCHYVRRLGLSLIESILAAVVFVYGWFPARNSLEWSIVTGAWLPLALWGVEGFVTSGRRSFLVATQVAVVMQLLAGHFNLAFITLFAIVIYAPLRLVLAERPPGQPAWRLVPIVLVLLLACGSAAIQLVPTWELKGRSQRSSLEFDEQRIGYGSIPWSYFPQSIRPWDFYPHVKEPEFHKKHFGDKNTNKVEAHLYFGLVPLGLAVISLAVSLLEALGVVKTRQPPGAWPWLVIGVLCLVLTPGWWIPWASHLPGFGYFTGPGRYGLLVQMALGVLAALGLRAVREWILWSGQVLRPSLARAVIAFGTVTIVYATELWTQWAGGFRAFWTSLAPLHFGWFGQAQLSVNLLIAAVVVGVLIADRASRRVGAAVVAALCVMLAWVDYSLVAPNVRDTEIRSESPLRARELSTVSRVLRQTRPDARLLARHQNAVSLCGIATVPIYLGIGPSEYFSGPLRIPDDFHWESTLAPRTLRWLEWSGVTHVLAFDPMASESLDLVWADYDPFLHELLGRPAWQPLMLYEIRSARGRAYSVPVDQARQALEPQGSPSQLKYVREIHRSANQTDFAVECDEESVVILTELMYPGWRAFVDDQPGEIIADTVFRAVQVGPGQHNIRWVYRPFSLRIGLLVTLISGVVTCMFFRRRRTPPRGGNTSQE